MWRALRKLENVAGSGAIPVLQQCLSSLEAALMIRMTMLNSLIQDGVSNIAGQLVIDTVLSSGTVV